MEGHVWPMGLDSWHMWAKALAVAEQSVWAPTHHAYPYRASHISWYRWFFSCCIHHTVMWRLGTYFQQTPEHVLLLVRYSNLGHQKKKKKPIKNSSTGRIHFLRWYHFLCFSKKNTHTGKNTASPSPLTAARGPLCSAYFNNSTHMLQNSRESSAILNYSQSNWSQTVRPAQLSGVLRAKRTLGGIAG